MATQERLEDAFAEVGYTGVFFEKSVHDRTGVALLVRHELYRIVEKAEVAFDELFRRNPQLQTHNNALIGLVEHLASGRRAVVASCHLHWDPAMVQVKTKQAHNLCHRIFAFHREHREERVTEKLCEKNKEFAGAHDKSETRAFVCDEEHSVGDRERDSEALKGGDRVGNNLSEASGPPGGEEERERVGEGESVPVIICGDFNSLPESDVVRLLGKGVAKRPVKCKEKVLRQPLALCSAYEAVGHPETNLTSKFVGCLDYVWFSRDLLAPELLLEPVPLQHKEVFSQCASLPNLRLPSDHICCMAVLRRIHR